MSNVNYPQPPSHRTFQLGTFTIDSNFDSGNCCNAQKAGPNQFNIWIGTDHPKNNYRTWFHFSIQGPSKGATLSFTIKNMQNQSRLLNEGLVPVYRTEGSSNWNRISQKVNTAGIEYNQGWIQWTFKHRFQSEQKHFFAFFYPWSNDDNRKFLDEVQLKVKEIPDIYFYRGTIIQSLEGRPVQFLTISSNKFKNLKEDKIEDSYLFKNCSPPYSFGNQKPAIIISARVHPGEVPGSHVMTGIIKTLTEAEGIGKLLREQFVFYIFPILNPDGVGRGHYRVDTNGINLNRCYLTPSPKQHPSIYAIKKVIMFLHEKNKFYGFLDLHAHAARRGTFIYGNYSSQLMKQTDACLFPKLLSMNSQDFEYEGSNFTEKNMNCKDRGDHMSKEGSGRVAMFRATKNANCWTLQCNYNISKVLNILEERKEKEEQYHSVTEQNLQQKLIVDWKPSKQTQAKQFFTMETYQKLGTEICETFLDLIEKNPWSRINNAKNYFKSVKYVKMNLALSLLRMAPNRFQSGFKKVYYGITNTQSPQVIQNSLKALYYLTIRNAKIANINGFIKNGDISLVNLPIVKKPTVKTAYRTRSQRSNPIVKGRKQEQKIDNNVLNFVRSKEEERDQSRQVQVKSVKEILSILKEQQQENQANSINIQSYNTMSEQKRCSLQKNISEAQKISKQQQQGNHNFIAKKVFHYQKQTSLKKVSVRIDEFRMIGISSMRKSMGQQLNEQQRIQNYSLSQKGVMMPSSDFRATSKSSKVRSKDFGGNLKYKEELMKIRLTRKGQSAKEAVVYIG